MGRLVVTGVRISGSGDKTYVDVHCIDEELGNGGVTGFKVQTVKAALEAAMLLQKAIQATGAVVCEAEWGFDTFGKTTYPKIKSARLLPGVTFTLGAGGVKYSDVK